ncbi:DCC1-like thiol-disulfide oxidoreductase family protein [Paludifilum halophilum]|uniref:HTTM-like domain-containing protein n=1 Tax=Paludifilum halophilum TaxID=1642702 RepID=A0A235B4Q1_9BACL|nr:DCC1-like thiol-disulfide oxidoreductase family protein [Paludifilum halophilum]OYD06939.1 hypothetical protein CHM34_13450 [Paludifilum halophilum]
MIRRIEDFLTREHMLIGAGLLRMTIGLGILFHLIDHYPERHLLWGEKGLWPIGEFLSGAEERGIYTLFHLSDAPWVFEGIYHGGILVVLLFTLGYRTRITTVCTFILFWSLYYRTPFITNGGDNLVRIVLFFLLFANAGARLSLDRRRRKPPLTGESTLRPFAAVLHNFAVFAIILQLLLLYFNAGIYKVMGSMWQGGTAVYYAMRVQDYFWPGISDRLWQSESLVVFLTYSSVLFQIAFPFLLLNRYTKYAAVIAAFLFHTGVGLMMNLALFSWYMIGCEWILLSDRDYRFWAERARSLGAKGGLWMNRVGERVGFLTRRKITVFYDGWCPFCTRSVHTAKKLDGFGLIHFVSFREPGVTASYGLDPDRLEKRLHSTKDGLHFHEGIDGIIQMVSRLPLLWPFWPLLILSRRLGIGQRVYDWIAGKRTIIPAGGCDEHCSIGSRTSSTRQKTSS